MFKKGEIVSIIDKYKAQEDYDLEVIEDQTDPIRFSGKTLAVRICTDSRVRIIGTEYHDFSTGFFHVIGTVKDPFEEFFTVLDQLEHGKV